jgi:hypothetical protein
LVFARTARAEDPDPVETFPYVAQPVSQWGAGYPQPSATVCTTVISVATGPSPSDVCRHIFPSLVLAPVMGGSDTRHALCPSQDRRPAQIRMRQQTVQTVQTVQRRSSCAQPSARNLLSTSRQMEIQYILTCWQGWPAPLLVSCQTVSSGACLGPGSSRELLFLMLSALSAPMHTKHN